MPQIRINQGDVVGLLLDLGQRTLSVYLNGARRGVMVAPGMKKVFGEAVVSLAGPLRWAVDVFDGASVHIQRRPAPGPVPSAEEVAARSRGTKPPTVGWIGRLKIWRERQEDWLYIEVWNI
jgi:hypothetical protein